MNPQSYVQTQCPRCGVAAWGHPAQAVPCGSCGQLIPPVGQQQSAAPPPMPFAPAAAPAAQPYQQNPYAPQPVQPQAQGSSPQVKIGIPLGVGGFKIPIKVGAGSKFKIIGLVAAVIIGGIAFAIVKGKIKGSGGSDTAKGNLSYSSLGLDAHKADPDKMITSVAGQASKWKKDSVWWGVNYQYVKGDGTIDTEKAGAEVTYISMSGVQAESKNDRKDSIKKFEFGPSGVSFDDMIYSATDPWTDVVPPKIPACPIKQLIKTLNAKGMKPDQIVRVQYDPDEGDAWRVFADDDDKLAGYYAAADCSPVKPQ